MGRLAMVKIFGWYLCIPFLLIKSVDGNRILKEA